MRNSDAIPKAYRPAATSSKTMPQPAGSRSNRRTGKRLGDIEEAEEDQRDQRVAPVGGAEEQRDPLAGHFVDHDEAGIVRPRSRSAMVAAGTPRTIETNDADGQGEKQRRAE